MGEKHDYLIRIKHFCQRTDKKDVHGIYLEFVVAIHSCRFVYTQAFRSDGCPY
jgi:hypothetical protein